jgi:hypothetical protein
MPTETRSPATGGRIHSSRLGVRNGDMIGLSTTRFRRLFLAAMPVGFGVTVGALTMLGIMQLMLRIHPSPEVTMSRLAVPAWFHAMMGLSSFAAGTAAAWNYSWATKGCQWRTSGGLYGFGVAFGWLIVLTCAVWRLMLFARPLFLLDLILVALAGILGQRMSRRAPRQGTPKV